jgi:hypothetical protein
VPEPSDGATLEAAPVPGADAAIWLPSDADGASPPAAKEAPAIKEKAETNETKVLVVFITIFLFSDILATLSSQLTPEAKVVQRRPTKKTTHFNVGIFVSADWVYLHKQQRSS